MSAVEERDVVILGSGPAGLTAALYAARANLKPLVLKGVDAGGQLMLTTEVENYPGFPDAVLGPELMERLEKQAARFEADLLHQAATRVDLSARPFGIWSGDEEWRTQTLIVATGASARWLGVPGESRLRGRGVSSCATCDGFFFRDRPLVVVGGGDSAIAGRDDPSCTRMQDRALASEKIEFIWNTEVREVLGDQSVTGVRLGDVETSATRDLEVAGVFVAIGHDPNTQLLQGQLELDHGYVRVRERTTHTSVDGVFAAGDVVDHVYRQAVTAAGMGCQAAIDAERFLEANPA